MSGEVGGQEQSVPHVLGSGPRKVKHVCITQRSSESTEHRNQFNNKPTKCTGHRQQCNYPGWSLKETPETVCKPLQVSPSAVDPGTRIGCCHVLSSAQTLRIQLKDLRNTSQVQRDFS